VSGPEALVVWQLIGAGLTMVVAPMAYSCKVSGQYTCVCRDRHYVESVHLCCSTARITVSVIVVLGKLLGFRLAKCAAVCSLHETVEGSSGFGIA
jgi:hypothetical protein